MSQSSRYCVWKLGASTAWGLTVKGTKGQWASTEHSVRAGTVWWRGFPSLLPPTFRNEYPWCDLFSYISMDWILLMIPRVKYYSGLKPWPLNLGHLGKQHTRKPSWFGSGLKAEGVKGPAPSHCQPQSHLPWVVPQWAGVGPHHLPTVSAQCPNLSSREFSGQCPPCLWPCGGSTLLSLCCHEKPLKISQMMSVNADGCKQCGNNPHIHSGVKWEN